jgi:hypothetical protein
MHLIWFFVKHYIYTFIMIQYIFVWWMIFGCMRDEFCENCFCFHFYSICAADRSVQRWLAARFYSSWSFLAWPSVTSIYHPNLGLARYQARHRSAWHRTKQCSWLVSLLPLYGLLEVYIAYGFAKVQLVILYFTKQTVMQ